MLKQETRLDGRFEETAVSDSNFCRWELSVSLRSPEHDQRTRQEIQRIGRGILLDRIISNRLASFFTVKSSYHRHLSGIYFSSSHGCLGILVKTLQVQACGSVVTEEQPHAMLIPLEYFLMGYGLYRPTKLSYSPRSPLSPLCISPELLSPESMGLKLKPIKTRISLKVWED